jgi:hypothetical protein
MYTFDDVVEIDQFFDKENFDKTLSILKEPKWAFRNISSETYKHKIFWVMDLSGESFFTETLFEKVKEVIGSDYLLNRVYANGQTYGLDGAPHSDEIFDSSCTLLVYMNAEWDLLWGGYTVFLNRYHDTKTGKDKFFDGDAINKTKKILPSPNKAIFFPGTIYHYAESPTRDFYGLRMTLAYKLRKVR